MMKHLQKYEGYKETILNNLYLVELINACDNSEKLKELINKGYDVNAEDEHGTPLFHCIREGHAIAAQILIDNGANVNIKNHFDESPLSESISMRRYGITCLLLENGADPNTTRRLNRYGNNVISVFDSLMVDYNYKYSKYYFNALNLFIKQGVNFNTIKYNSKLKVYIENNIDVQRIILDYREDLIGNVLKKEDIKKELKNDPKYEWIFDSNDLGLL